MFWHTSTSQAPHPLSQLSSYTLHGNQIPVMVITMIISPDLLHHPSTAPVQPLDFWICLPITPPPWLHTAHHLLSVSDVWLYHVEAADSDGFRVDLVFIVLFFFPFAANFCFSFYFTPQKPLEEQKCIIFN